MLLGFEPPDPPPPLSTPLLVRLVAWVVKISCVRNVSSKPLWIIEEFKIQWQLQKLRINKTVFKSGANQSCWDARIAYLKKDQHSVIFNTDSTSGNKRILCFSKQLNTPLKYIFMSCFYLFVIVFSQSCDLDILTKPCPNFSLPQLSKTAWSPTCPQIWLCNRGTLIKSFSSVLCRNVHTLGWEHWANH